MSQFELNAEKVAENMATLKAISEDQKDRLANIAKAVIAMPESSQKEDVLNSGKKYQDQLNSQLDGVNNTIQSMQAVIDIASYMEKYSAEADVSTADSSAEETSANRVVAPAGF